VHSYAINRQSAKKSVLEVTGVSKPKGHQTDGSSLCQLLRGRGDPSHEQTFLVHFPLEHRSSYFTSYRAGDWKLVHLYHPKAKPNKKGTGQPKTGKHELFNLKTDPTESDNLASQERERLASMIQAMDTALQNEGALFPIDSDGNVLRPSL